ncbi:MAG TPA: trehalose-6-phosphate synthase [Acidimicrobiia bacterium]|nr:trehalose-6-phosphate synthase [Acidimicrobiia bacterium]
MDADLVIAANRGPVTFVRGDDGGLVATHGAGGLASALGPLVRGTGATWVAAAMTDGDREAAARGLIEIDGYRYRCVVVDPRTYDLAYGAISNTTLWFLHHRLWDLARQPRFDTAWREAWEAYRVFNRTVADVIASDAPDAATVLVQDFHLSLVATSLSKQRPDLRLVHFHHIPFCEPEDLAVLPTAIAEELLEGLSAHAACGFHTDRWADAFGRCCDAVLGQRPPTFVAPLGPDAASFDEVIASPAGDEAGRALDALVGDRRMILRVDRMEPAKNVLRGFLAFDELLGAHPEWVGRVVFVALVYPSRQGIAEYVTYRHDVEALADDMNRRWGTDDWTPIVLDARDDFARSAAAMQRYDVLLVNPVRDGLNLVAKEGPMLNQRDGVLLLSTEAGAWSELENVALAVHPFDVSATADQLAVALSMSPADRRVHAASVRDAATRRSPRDWLADQLAAASV